MKLEKLGNDMLSGGQDEASSHLLTSMSRPPFNILQLHAIFWFNIILFPADCPSSVHRPRAPMQSTMTFASGSIGVLAREAPKSFSRTIHPSIHRPQCYSSWSTPRTIRHSIPPPTRRPQALQLRREFSSTSPSRHGHLDPPRPGEERHVTFIDKSGSSHTFTVADGDNLLDIAQANDLEMEGACGGSCACSTCHVVVQDPEMYDKMEEPDDDENDMLDLAFGLTETSRLGCQIKMSKELDGLVVKLPSMTRNVQGSDFAKK